MPQPTGITGIDHVVILAQALDRARETYERLGFTLTPRGMHTKLDTANHCIMLAENNYFELLSVVKPQPLNADFGAILKEREGLAALALKTDDARAAVPKLGAAGLGPKEAVDFSRPVDRPEGRREARFTVVHLDGAKTPGGRSFLCQHHTPELVWLPEYLEHENGALGLARITLIAGNSDAAAGAYGTLFGAAPKSIAGGAEVATGNAPVRVLSPAAFATAYPGEDGFARHQPVFAVLSLRVRTPETAAALLKKRGIGFAAIAGGIRLAAKDATGVVLEFLS